MGFGYQFENGEMPAKGTPIEIGKGRVVRRPGASNRGRTKKDRVTILSFGTRLHDALIAAQEVEDARFMKPLDIDLIRELADDSGTFITVEEGSIGGFGDHVLHFLSLDGALDDGT